MPDAFLEMRSRPEAETTRERTPPDTDAVPWGDRPVHGLIFGLPFGFALTAGWADESVRAWRVAHVGMVAVGLLLMAIGIALGQLVLIQRDLRSWCSAHAS